MIELATTQVAWGADVLDINVGVPGIDEVALLPEVVKLVSSVVKAPLCIDSPNHEALAAALPVAPGKPLVNSVNGEEKSLQRVLPLVKDRGAAVIGLTMDDDGIPATAEARLALAGKIIERATRIGIPIEDIVIDPLVLTVGADSNAAASRSRRSNWCTRNSASTSTWAPATSHLACRIGTRSIRHSWRWLSARARPA